MMMLFPGSRSLICTALILSLCFFALVATAEISESPGEQNQINQNTNSSATATKRRRPLPKPSGPRFFEQYSGKDSSKRLMAAGATRQTVYPARPLAPVEGRAYDARPFFAWDMVRGARVYHFAIYEGDLDQDPSAKLVYQTDRTVTELKYPQEAPMLEPGRLYSWRVATPTVKGNDEVGVVARLIILAGAEREEVQKELATAELTSPKTREDRLDQARVFENYGVWYDALEIASELAEDPKDKDALAYRVDLLDKLEPKP
jgi:hypothetical protein